MKYLILFLLVPIASFSQNKGASPIAGSQEPTANKNTYAVVIGISDYQDDKIPDLRYADKDAEAFANFLRSPAGGSLDGDHLKVLLNKEATMAQFASALDWMMESTKEGDQAIIYFSGHGDVEKKTLTQPGFLLCWDAPSRVYMGGGAFNLRDVQEIVSTLSIQNKAKVVVITDACRSGTLAGHSVGGAQATAANLARQYANEIKILSCQPSEYSIEGEQWGGGRGAFSYHLVNALYGLADGNNDLYVTLQEAGRYLEDHVTTEVAPVSQVPMVLGNRMERLAVVDGKLLADLRSGRTSQMAMLSPVEMRGLEEDVLAGADSLLIGSYHLFKKSLKERAFLDPAGSCAEFYYNRLVADPRMARLHSTLKRNYAAALQDDAQQAINIWLKADVQQLECLGKSLKLQPIPQQLGRAAELLGEGHYMYRTLQARKLLFEGILMQLKTSALPNEQLGSQILQLFKKASALEPNSPLPWHRMCLAFAENLKQVDSAFACARQARNLSPYWVLPYADLAYRLTIQKKLAAAKQALLEAQSMDSLHPYVINRWASWYCAQEGRDNVEKAVALFESYRQKGGALFPCWYNDYSGALVDLEQWDAAEVELKNAIALDSTNTTVWTSLGYLYFKTNRYTEAEPFYKKAISLDSSDVTAWNNLAYLYNHTGRLEESERAYKKSISLDSTIAFIWTNLGNLYSDSRRYSEAEAIYKKSLAVDSNYIPTWAELGLFYLQTRDFGKSEQAYKRAISLDSNYAKAWSQLGFVCIQTRRFDEAESFIKKALRIDSANANTWNNLGYLYLLIQRYAEAEQSFSQAIILDTNYANPRKHLGMICYRTNRPEEAGQHFLKAIELNPNYASAMLGFAYVLSAQGKTSEALGYVEQAIGKGSTFEQLEKDQDFAPLRATPEWKALMKKYFPDQIKD